MKLLWSGDPHGKVSTLDTFKAYLSHMLQAQEEHRPDFVIIAGDLFDGHATIRSEVMNQWLKYLRDSSVRHILMVGNHDETVPGSGVHALAAFEDMDRHEVVNTMFILPDVGQHTLAFISYVQTQKEFELRVEEVRRAVDPASTLLFLHQTIDGVAYDNGMYAPDGFSAHLVGDFKQVISGHIHSEQRFGNIWYPGTPYAQGFAGANENKSLWLIDANTSEVTRIPSPLPRYFVAELDASSVLQWFEDKDTKDGRRHHYKITLRDSKAAIRSLRDSNEFKRVRKNFKLMLCPEYVDIRRADRISDSVSPEKMMEKYVNEIMNTKLDRARLFEMANKMMRGE